MFTCQFKIGAPYGGRTHTDGVLETPALAIELTRHLVDASRPNRTAILGFPKSYPLNDGHIQPYTHKYRRTLQIVNTFCVISFKPLQLKALDESLRG